MKNLVLLILLLANFTLHAQIKPDSVIYTADGVVIAYVFERNQGLKYSEFRFYNSEGFYCISLYKKIDKEDCFYLGSQRVNPDEDLVFLVDTFEIGFLNRLLKDRGVNFNAKFENTVYYYYHSRDFRNDKRLKIYIDSIIEKCNIIIPNIKKEKKEEDLVFSRDTFEISFLNRLFDDQEDDFDAKYRNTVNYYRHSIDLRNDTLLMICLVSIMQKYNFIRPNIIKEKKEEVSVIIPTPTIRHRDIYRFKSVLLDKVRLNRNLKNKLGMKLSFAISTNRFGTILYLKRLSFINSRLNKKIDKNIVNLIGKKISYSSARRGSKLKGAFYIEID